jgi:hypothetical protein
MLIEFEETKIEINEAKEHKCNEINAYVNEKQSVDDKLHYANDTISKLESNVNDNNQQ